MDIDFWVDRWDSNRIGFHQDVINPYLAYFYGEKGPPIEKRRALKVFVPLSGKSKDLLWLSQNGYRVFAVECSERAVTDFFTENGLAYKQAENDQGRLFQSVELPSMIEVFQGDFFALQENDLDGITDVFDRASLVALPETMRSQYVTKMGELQPPGIRTLLVTLTYDVSEMDGPPFSVTEEEVHALYDSD